MLRKERNVKKKRLNLAKGNISLGYLLSKLTCLICKTRLGTLP